MVKTDNFSFSGIGFEAYERLGDLQGSGLLQTEVTLRAALRQLKKNCQSQRIRYLELRCSPCKYSRGGLTPGKVMEILYSELNSCDHTIFKIIIIGSRHGDKDEMKAHVGLVLDSLENPELKDFIAGFDLAGNEGSATPSMVREQLLPLMENCLRLTIHAGEGTDARNIWEAVYLLNASRIGHGLTLIENKKLMPRFVDRRVFIEMCPSSNYQIIGYHDFSSPVDDIKDIYPLKTYLQNGLKVTINTDNPGISRTSLTEEFLAASRLTSEGLSKWNILQIIKNSFQGSFLNPADKKALMLDVEKELVSLLE
jgi:adenosine deaminase